MIKAISFTFNKLPAKSNLIIPALKQKCFYILNGWTSDTNTLTRLDIEYIDKIRDLFRYSSISCDLE
jgi:hypothetical protein